MNFGACCSSSVDGFYQKVFQPTIKDSNPPSKIMTQLSKYLVDKLTDTGELFQPIVVSAHLGGRVKMGGQHCVVCE